MNEEFLQYVWKHQLFNKDKLVLSSGEKFEIIHQGQWNFDAGPDFFNAKVKIGDTLWAGNIEIHLNSSDWNKHQHQIDLAYNNVILHVVTNHDMEIVNQLGNPIPTFILQYKHSVFENYNQLINKSSWPACSETFSQVNNVYVALAIQSLVVERLEHKIQPILKLLKDNKNDWNETFYQLLASSFGFKTNALPFEMIARSLPVKILTKHKNNLFQLEALLFGQSGMLNQQLLGDDYFLKLRNEYSHLAAKYQLHGLEGHLWKFLRLRPSNFPTIRIAQFAKLIFNSSSLLSKVIETETIDELMKFFDAEASEYWSTHYHFNHSSKMQAKRIGNTSKIILLINTVVPFLFVYGKENNKPELKDRAFQFLEQLPVEKNFITKRWAELGLIAVNAADSQALIQLKNVYCENKKCLNCKIGTKVINR